MGNYRGYVTRPALDAFVSMEKPIEIPHKGFQRKPNNNSYAEMRFPFYDKNGMTIPGWSMLVQVKNITLDMCKEAYIVFYETERGMDTVFRLDVTPKIIKSHNDREGKTGDMYGAHFHELDRIMSIAEDFDFECFEQKHRKDWLNFVATKLKITVIEPQIDDLFGGWPWTA
ncbi:MAG: hypothetical protein WCS28_04220 [Thiomicrospira sp.]